MMWKGKQMAKPAILVVDDDAQVLRAIERDLRHQYGGAYRVVRATSAGEALDALRQLKLRNAPVALLLSDQRMPDVTGIEFLEQAMTIYPDAKRALLTAYADTDAAISAINTVKIDYYLMKPWEPPEDKLYPVLDDLLDDWQAAYRPDFEGIRVIGHRWSAEGHQIRDFLARNQVPYRWLDVEADNEALRLIEFAGADPARLPVVLFPDGTALVKPTNAELAAKIGFQMRATLPFYDLIIVGAGPAGLAAAVYGTSEGLRTLLIEREAPGGQAGTSSRIENYLGFPQGISGAELARRAVMQARRFGVEMLTQEVLGVRVDGSYRIVTLADGSCIGCRALLIATGVSYRKLDVPGIDQLTGAGVYYGAAMAEAMECRDEEVYMVGGANSVGQAAVYFARYVRKVVVLVRGDSLASSMSHYLIDQIDATPNIEVRTNTRVVEVEGETKIQAMTLANSRDGTTVKVPATSLFIMIGALPQTDWLAGVVERDANGFIIAGPDLVRDGRRARGFDREPFLLETSVPGIFVAGDVRANSVKRVASSVGEGAIAIQFVHHYLATL